MRDPSILVGVAGSAPCRDGKPNGKSTRQGAIRDAWRQAGPVLLVFATLLLPQPGRRRVPADCIHAGSASRPRSAAQSHAAGGGRAEAALPRGSQPAQGSSVPPKIQQHAQAGCRLGVFSWGASSPHASKPGKAPQNPTEARGGEIGWRGRLKGGVFFPPTRTEITSQIHHPLNPYR